MIRFTKGLDCTAVQKDSSARAQRSVNDLRRILLRPCANSSQFISIIFFSLRSFRTMKRLYHTWDRMQYLKHREATEVTEIFFFRAFILFRGFRISFSVIISRISRFLPWLPHQLGKPQNKRNARKTRNKTRSTQHTKTDPAAPMGSDAVRSADDHTRRGAVKNFPGRRCAQFRVPTVIRAQRWSRFCASWDALFGISIANR